jgi:hypothetical protein
MFIGKARAYLSEAPFKPHSFIGSWPYLQTSLPGTNTKLLRTLKLRAQKFYNIDTWIQGYNTLSFFSMSDAAPKKLERLSLESFSS